ncbi:MAG: SIMPL domain-containing protein [Chthonomonadales bacterium]
MKTTLSVLTLLALAASICTAQVSGNSAYSQQGGSARAEQHERNKVVIAKEDMPPAGSMFVEANVLVNVLADEYVAVFGIAQEGGTVADCNVKMDLVLSQLTAEFKQLGVGQKDMYVDFVAQTKIYSFEVNSDIAREKLTGFELKKNIAVHYKNKTLLDRLILAAAKSQVYDLIKVDYIVKDATAIQNRLMEEAAKVLKQKSMRYEKLLGTKLKQPAQVYAEKPAVYYPTEMYDSYTAAESEDVTAGYYRQKYIIVGTRKGRTFYFNGLSAKGFDHVVNPVVIEPVVQFTLYLKVKYDIDKNKTQASMDQIRHK